MGYYPSLREYVRTLENREKLFRIQREVCRETELHPLVRWQFRGLPENERRAFLFAKVSSGAALTERMLKEKPDLVRRFLRGTLRALLWFRTHEIDAVARMAEGFKISPDDALGIYKATLKSYTLDGTISRELQEKIVTFQRKQLKVEKDIPPESVYDFTILRALNDERKKSRP